MRTTIFKIQGVVQGVGFRPFVYRIALKHGIFGFVCNDMSGVCIYAQGEREKLNQFELDLKNPPSAAKITSFKKENLFLTTIYKDFSIQTSLQEAKEIQATIPADIALCKECLEELRDRKNRRWNYAFMSCTNCGARYSLIQSLPYDRKTTAMASFKMCARCQEEYDNPHSRRFHSEINCCEDCGPKLLYTDTLESFKQFQEGTTDSKIPLQESFLENPLQRAVSALKNGKILALKGIGGYTLICNALQKESIVRLRKLKNRPSKPFALMCKDLEMAESYVFLSAKEKEILTTQTAPILLATSKESAILPLKEIAPNLNTLGIILPYAAIHYLLFDWIDFPLIFTSANLSGEPIIKDFNKIAREFSGICDGVLWHNRDILNPIDDSLVRCIGDKMQVLRRARGFLCDVLLRDNQRLLQKTMLDFIALGAQQKATFCLGMRDKLLLSPHLGDLETYASVENFLTTKNLFCTQYKREPKEVVLDLHPNYTQRHFIAQGDSVHFVQHHFAHLLANIAENSLNGEVLGVVFDGTGFGSDGRIWGGEFLSWDSKKPLEFQRVAYFDDFALLGGERAVYAIKRLGLSGLFKAFGANYKDVQLSLLREFSLGDMEIFYTIQEKQVLCHSVGRLFDMVSALCGLCFEVRYEGEGGMILEAQAQRVKKGNCYSFKIDKNVVFWKQMVEEICLDLRNGVAPFQIAYNFHLTLARIIQEVSKDFQQVALSGGCFQNALLTQLALEALQDKKVYLHSQIPCNDGGISFGQAYYLLLKHSNKKSLVR